VHVCYALPKEDIGGVPEEGDVVEDLFCGVQLYMGPPRDRKTARDGSGARRIEYK